MMHPEDFKKLANISFKDYLVKNTKGKMLKKCWASSKPKSFSWPITWVKPPRASHPEDLELKSKKLYYIDICWNKEKSVDVPFLKNSSSRFAPLLDWNDQGGILMLQLTKEFAFEKRIVSRSRFFEKIITHVDQSWEKRD